MLGLMRVLVTGAARAIGRATAEILTARGHEVVATARDVSLLAGLPVDRILCLDVSDAASVTAAVEAAGELDAVVNNAGRTGSGPLEDYPLDDFAACPRRQHPRPAPHGAGGGATVAAPGQWWGVGQRELGTGPRRHTARRGLRGVKARVEALSEVLHYELGHFGIRVVIIEPGYIAPGMRHTADHAGPDVYRGLHEQWSGTAEALAGPGGRPGPELVAHAVADALEDPSTPLRVEVGDDAAMVLALRRAQSDAEFEATMRQALGLTW